MITKTIKSKYIITEGKRIDGKFFLNNDALLSLKMKENENKCSPLSKFALVFNPPVFKRQFCQNTPNAVQYFQSSDVPAASEQSSVFINKKQAEKVNAIVKENQILVTGFGTIGNVRLVSKLQEGVAYANNTCRIEVNHNFNYGFIYAFMASKYGKAQLNNNGSGSVVRYIEAPGIKRTLIPIFPENKQLEIHNLIVESAELRVEANKILKIVETLFHDSLKINSQTQNKSQIGSRKISEIQNSFQVRLDAPSFINNGVKLIESLSREFDFVDLGKLAVNIRRPGIFKRVYVDKGGLPYIKGSELGLCNPFTNCVYLSKTKTPFLDELKLQQNQILITCAGSVGNVRLITKEFEDLNSIGSQDIIRIESNDKLFTSEYIFGYLRLPVIFDYVQSLKYGSVIERIEPFHVGRIPILKPSIEFSNEITQLVKQYKNHVYAAFCQEQKAIQLVENEIEQWQH